MCRCVHCAIYNADLDGVLPFGALPGVGFKNHACDTRFE